MKPRSVFCKAELPSGTRFFWLLLMAFLVLAGPVSAETPSLPLPAGVPGDSDLGRLISSWDLRAKLTLGPEITLGYGSVTTRNQGKSMEFSVGEARFDRMGTLLAAQPGWGVFETDLGSLSEVRYGANGTLHATRGVTFGWLAFLIPNVEIVGGSGRWDVKTPDTEVPLQQLSRYGDVKARILEGRLLLDMSPLLPSWAAVAAPPQIRVLSDGSLEAPFESELQGASAPGPDARVTLKRLRFSSMKNWDVVLGRWDSELTLPGPWGSVTLTSGRVAGTSYVHIDYPEVLRFPHLGLSIEADSIRLEGTQTFFGDGARVSLSSGGGPVVVFPEKVFFTPDGRLNRPERSRSTPSKWGLSNLFVDTLLPKDGGMLIRGAIALPKDTPFRLPRTSFSIEDLWIPPSGVPGPCHLKLEDPEGWSLFDVWEFRPQELQWENDRLTLTGSLPLPGLLSPQTVTLRDIGFDLATGRTRSPQQTGQVLRFTVGGVEFRMDTFTVRPEAIRFQGTAQVPAATRDSKGPKSPLAGQTLRIQRLEITPEGQVTVVEASLADGTGHYGKADILREGW